MAKKLLDSTCAIFENKLNDAFQEGPRLLIISGLLKLRGKNKKQLRKTSAPVTSVARNYDPVT